MKICLYPGNFNPITNIHLLNAMVARRFFKFDKVIFCPVREVHMKTDVSERKDMIRDVLGELRGSCYLVKYGLNGVVGDLTEFYADFNDSRFTWGSNGVRIRRKYFVLLGTEEAYNFYSWNKAAELEKEAKIVWFHYNNMVITKDDVIKKNGVHWQKTLFAEFPARNYPTSGPELRKIIADPVFEKEVNGLVSPHVIEHVLKNKLYI